MDSNNLRRILEDGRFSKVIKDENQKFETFTGQRRLILIAMDHVIKFKSTDYKLRGLAVRVDESAAYCRVLRDPSTFRSLFVLLMSVVQELRVIFTFPKQQMPNTSPFDWRPNDELMVFINFLHQILGKIRCLEVDFVVSPVEDSIKILQTELEFLIIFLGDAPMRLNVEPTRNAFEDIRVFVNQVGSFLYTLFSTLDDQDVAADRLDLALSDLVQKCELLKEKMMDHCTVVSKLQGSAAIKTDATPVFIVDSLLDDLKDHMDHNADRIGCTKELMLLRSSLDNISLAQFAEPGEVMISIRDLVYEIEYVIESSPPWYLSRRLRLLLQKIQLIKMAKQEKNKCGQDGYVEEEYPREEQLTSQEGTPIFVGFQHTETEVTEKLIGGPSRQQIISLVGMPGLGKTTLANKLFNDPSVVHHFDKHAWCIVSQTYKRKNVLVDILESTWDPRREEIMQMEEHENDILASTKHQKREKMMQMEEDELGEKLYKSLKRMRYLIVLDDIWEVQPWDDLEKYLPDDIIGSRILFTTRNKEVGLRASPNNIIGLPFLSDNECWELMQQKLFPTKPFPQELLEIGKQIATSCHGLPLSLTLIASVLANMPKEKSSWETVARNLSTYLLDNEDNCLHILKLSYQHLPAHLKPCFLYFGVFGEDEVIPVRKLISLWVAEGFIKKEDNKSLEDVAHSYLINLINRGLVLISGRRSNGGVKTCIIHDLLYDMCLRIAREKNIMKDINFGFFRGLSRKEQDIHLPVWVYHSVLRPFDPYLCSHLGRRSLDLKYPLQQYDDHMSKELRLMVHLRYLGVGYAMPSIEFPNKLEYLRILNYFKCEIPETVLKLENLRGIYFKGGAYLSESCRLRAIKDDSFQMKNVQSISSLHIDDEMDAQVLGCAPNLRRLKCHFSIGCPSFHFPDQLESLSITAVPYPCPKFPMNLKKLTLCGFILSWEEVRMIGSLQNLEVLKLQNGDITEKNWETEEGEFQNLKFLELNDVRIANSFSAKPYGFAEWNPATDDYPKLERLVLRKCHCLKMIPSSLGFISTLRTIEVHGCSESIVDSAMDILEEQKEEYGNEELNVVISRY